MDPGLKILGATAMKSSDTATMLSERMHSRDLMWRASQRLSRELISQYGKNHSFHVLCGPGNNGGDGLCVAAILAQSGYNVNVSLIAGGKPLSPDLAYYHELFQSYKGFDLKFTGNGFPEFDNDQIIIDALFGTGLNKPAEGYWKEVIALINRQQQEVISIDVPSGMLDSEPQRSAVMVNASKVFTVQSPKPGLLYFENKIDFKVIDCGINTDEAACNSYYLDPDSAVVAKQIDVLIPAPDRHSHKGSMGHTLLIGGNSGMKGAIALAAQGCIKAGSGKCTVWSPEGLSHPLAMIPKAMQLPYPLDVSGAKHIDFSKFSSVAIGPGLGITAETKALMEMLLNTVKTPLILDADALNIIAQNSELFRLIPEGSILTPHPGELERLFGKLPTGKEREAALTAVSMKSKIHILAKDTFSALFCPDGKVFYNGTGGPHLSQGGSGDTLCGLIAGYYARCNNMRNAAITAMYLAGK